ncbi:MAG: flagellar brake protein [Gammaproteobacteria bacterium]|nr:flagellar brake protein [Gammaproteobacteria bacterium]
MNLNLQTLNTLIGSTIQLESESSKSDRYTAQFIGYSNNQSLILSALKIGNSPVVPTIDDTFIMRFSDGEKALAFRSQVIEVCESPYVYIHLSFPKGVEGTLLRRGQRYDVSAMKKPVLKLAMSDGETQTNVQLTDISQAGACMTASDKLGNIDDSFAIDIVVDSKQISLPCKIRYVRKENSETNNTAFIHGVEFQQMDLDAQLFIDKFIQQHVQQQRTTH